MKVLIVIDNLNTGGIATSLYNLLPQLKDKNVEFDLLVFDQSSIDKEKIPSHIKILPSNNNLRLLAVPQSVVRKESMVRFARRANYVLISKVLSGNMARNILFLFEKKRKQYDLAISYCHDLSWNSFTPGCRHFISSKVSAKEKAVYIHCDYQNFGGYDRRQKNDYDKMSKILTVSKSCSKSFITCFPELEGKVEVLENFTNTSSILEKSKNAISYEGDKLNFVSVSRLSEEKAIDSSLEVFSRLNKDGLSNTYHWTIVGDGPERARIEQLIERYDLKNNVDLVGQKDNPYIYIKNASALLLLSKHEAAPMVYGESCALGVPVIVTRTVSADELVHDRGIGLVCDNSTEKIYQLLHDVLLKPEILNRFRALDIDVNSAAKKQLNKLLMQEDN